MADAAKKPARKREAEEIVESDVSDSEREESTDYDDNTSVRLAKLKREKRLKMNRESAKKRREHQKLRLIELEAQVDQLQKKNQHITFLNENLTTKVQNLEGELAVARSTVSMLTSQPRQVEASNNPNFFGMLGHAAADQPIGDLLRRQQASQLPSQSLPVASLLRQRNAELRGVSGMQGLSMMGMAAPISDLPGGIHAQSIQNTVITLYFRVVAIETTLPSGFSHVCCSF